jgi:hypothetical protein
VIDIEYQSALSVAGSTINLMGGFGGGTVGTSPSGANGDPGILVEHFDGTTPEPASLLMFGLGLAGVSLARWCRSR